MISPDANGVSWPDSSGLASRAMARLLTGLRQTVVALLGLTVLLAPQSIASGLLGPAPIGPYKFRSFTKCKEYLEEEHANAVASIRSTQTDDHAKSQQSLETEGVVQTGKREAHYDVLRRFVSRIVMDDSKTIQSQYSYEESNFACRGRVLTGTRVQGYHLPTYDHFDQPAKEATAMTTAETTTIAGNPALSAEEVGKRFLKLIEGLKSKSDLSLKLVRDTMGMNFSPIPGDPNHFVSEAYAAPGWSYVVGYIEETLSIDKAAFLEFRNSEARFSDMTPICAVDFDYYHNALRSMGFRDSPTYGEIGQLEDWRYFKNDIEISITPQNVIPGETGRLCVKSISTLN
jgi:hypothetical protein